MQVLVDTSVWSLALRRAPEPGGASHVAVATLRDLIADGRACMMGPIRQELLSGIKSAAQLQSLKEALLGFDDLALVRTDFELAAEFFNLCRGQGLQGSHTDFLICAAASTRKLPILTTDKGFLFFAKHLPIRLLEN